MSLLSVLFDNLQGLTVCEYSYEYQEYNTLDELHHLCGKAHHRQTTVQDDVQKRTNDDILKTYLRTTGNRHTAQYQCNQDLVSSWLPPEEVTEPTLITLINAANPVIAPASV